MKLTRHKNNPILTADKNYEWEAGAVFNPSVVFDNGVFHMVYRGAISGFSPLTNDDDKNYPSAIGYAKSQDGIHFTRSKEPLIKPENDWERYGCEDPRITKLNGKYYIFYTALSTFPYAPAGIKIGVAIAKNFTAIEKHLVTHFNSKAMALFPEKINGKIYGLLAVHTDIQPAKIAIIDFENESQIWTRMSWEKWYADLDSHILHIEKKPHDQVEVGAPPIKTERGWLLIYSYIKNYLNSEPCAFEIRAMLLDIKNPLKIVGNTPEPLLVPEKEYELRGLVPRVTFPTGAAVVGDKLYVYYGAADTSCCLATCELKELLNSLV